MRALSKPLTVLTALAIAGCASSGSADTAANTGTMAAAQPQAPAAQTPAAADPAPMEAAGDAHFTKDQADSGRDTFRALCTECHYSGEFNDDQFKFKWSRRSALNLYEIIFNQMPESAPGSLTEGEAVGLVAYILRMNGFEEGSGELTSDEATLTGISLRSIRD